MAHCHRLCFQIKLAFCYKNHERRKAYYNNIRISGYYQLGAQCCCIHAYSLCISSNTSMDGGVMKVRSIFIDKLGGIRLEDKECPKDMTVVKFEIKQPRQFQWQEHLPDSHIPNIEIREFQFMQYSVSNLGTIVYRVYEEL